MSFWRNSALASMSSLAVECHERAAAGDDQRIDLDQAGIAFLVKPVQRQHDGLELIDLLALQADAESQLLALEGLQSRGRMNRGGENAFGGVLGDLLDIHAARGRGHHRDATAFAIEGQTQIKLALDLGTRFDIHMIDRQSARAGLLGDEPLAEHCGRGGAHRGRVAHNLDATGLTAATRVHLRLDDPDLAAEGLRRGERLIRALGDAPVWYWHAVSCKHFLRLIFVQIHARSSRDQ